MKSCPYLYGALWGALLAFFSACADPASLLVQISFKDLNPTELNIEVRRTDENGELILDCPLSPGEAYPASCALTAGMDVWLGETEPSFILYGRPSTPLWLKVDGREEERLGSNAMLAQLPDEAGVLNELQLDVYSSLTEQQRCEAQLVDDGAELRSYALSGIGPAGALGPLLLVAVNNKVSLRDIGGLSSGATGCELREPRFEWTIRDCDVEHGSLVWGGVSAVDPLVGTVIAGRCVGKNKLFRLRLVQSVAQMAETITMEQFSLPMISNTRGTENDIVFLYNQLQGDAGIGFWPGDGGAPIFATYLAPRTMDGQFEPLLAGVTLGSSAPSRAISMVYATGLHGFSGLIGSPVMTTGCSMSSVSLIRFCSTRSSDLGASLRSPATLLLRGVAQREELLAIIELLEGGFSLTRLTFDAMNDTLTTDVLGQQPLQSEVTEDASRVVLGTPVDLTGPSLGLVVDGAALHRFDPVNRTVAALDALPPEALGADRVLMADLWSDDERISEDELVVWGPELSEVLVLGYSDSELKRLASWEAPGDDALVGVLIGRPTHSLFAFIRGGRLVVSVLGEGSYKQNAFTWPMMHRGARGRGELLNRQDPTRR